MLRRLMETEGVPMSAVARFSHKVLDPPSGRIRVAEAMHHGVLTCSRDTSLADVAGLMARRRVHCIVVTDEPENADSLWGVVSDLDLVAAAGVRDLDEQTAEASAATAALTVSPEETLQRAAQLMTEHGRRTSSSSTRRSGRLGCSPRSTWPQPSATADR
jgi:CBS domain-containing protein